MAQIFYYFFIAVGLSMDAFSLAIIYGLNDIKRKNIILLSILVGIFHFCMPNMSALLTKYFIFDLKSYANLISGIIFLILAVEMIISFNDSDTKYNIDNFFDLILFSFAVSIDSLSVGSVLFLDKENLIEAGIIFLIVSMVFTFIGLILGKKFNKNVGKISKIIGIVILFLISIKYFISFI